MLIESKNIIQIIKRCFSFRKSIEMITNYFRPKTLPPIAIGFFFSLLSHVLPSNYHYWIDYGTIGFFLDPVMIILLSITVIVCLLITHEKEWRGHWKWRKKYKILHWISFPTFALVASVTAYFAGVFSMFFGMVNIDSGYQLNEELNQLSWFLLIMTFLPIDLFNSLMGKSVLFRISPINRSPLKQYSQLEYKIKKHLPERINKILFEKSF